MIVSQSQLETQLDGYAGPFFPKGLRWLEDWYEDPFVPTTSKALNVVAMALGAFESNILYHSFPEDDKTWEFRGFGFVLPQHGPADERKRVLLLFPSKEALAQGRKITIYSSGPVSDEDREKFIVRYCLRLRGAIEEEKDLPAQKLGIIRTPLTTAAVTAFVVLVVACVLIAAFAGSLPFWHPKP